MSGNDRVVLLVNPTSGGGKAAKAAPIVVRRLRERGLDVIAVQGRDGADAIERTKVELAAAPTAALATCGGDGTVHLGLQAIGESGIPLGVLPFGTGNDNATALAMPTDPAAAADVVADGLSDPGRGIRTVDLGHVSASDGTQRWFLGVLSSGFDSLVNERANVMTWPNGQARYLRAILAELRVFKPVPYIMVLDAGMPREMRYAKPGMLVAVGNGTSYGGGMKVCPGALLDDGLLSVTFLDELATTTFLRVFPTVFKGTHVQRNEVHEHTAHSVMLDAPGQVAYADGERVGPLPIEVRAVPAALRVLVPIPA